MPRPRRECQRDAEGAWRCVQPANALDGSRADVVHGSRPPASRISHLGDEEMEMGVGIHGEPGRRRVKLASAEAIAEELTKAILTI